MSHSITLERIIEVPPDIAFSFWTEPGHIQHWFCYDGSWDCEQAEFRLVEAGDYHLAMRSPDGNLFSVRGTFQEIAPPDRLSYTWRVDGEPGETLVTVEFADLGTRTRVTLNHTQFQRTGLANSHQTGWQLSLDQYQSAIAQCTTIRRSHEGG